MKNCKEERINLTAALRKLEAFDGRYIGKLSESDAAIIRDVTATHNVMAQDIQGQSKAGSPTICLDGLRDKIAKAETHIHQLDKLETCPSLSEYGELIERLAHLEKQLRDESGEVAPAQLAKRFGLIRGFVNW